MDGKKCLEIHVDKTVEYVVRQSVSVIKVTRLCLNTNERMRHKTVRVFKFGC